MQPRDEHAKRMEQDEKSDDKFQHMNKTALVEAIIFASRGADRETIAKLTNFDQEEIATIVEELKNSYSRDNHGIELKEIEGYYRFYTKPQYSDVVSKVAKRRNLGSLSPSQLEIAIFLAVRRQATKLEIDSMRGKDSTNLIKQLLISGVIKRRKSGRSFVYSLTDTFKDESMIEELIKQAGGVSFESAWRDMFETGKYSEVTESEEEGLKVVQDENLKNLDILEDNGEDEPI